jgi:hypothetical protein
LHCVSRLLVDCPMIRADSWAVSWEKENKSVRWVGVQQERREATSAAEAAYRGSARVAEDSPAFEARSVTASWLERVAVAQRNGSRK